MDPGERGRDVMPAALRQHRMVEVHTVIWCVCCIIPTVDAAVKSLLRACANVTC